MATEEILIPDIGNFDSVDIIEVLISVGDTIALDDPLMTVESDKASMDIPAPKAGVIKEIKIKVGDKVKQGSLVALIESVATPAAEKEKVKPEEKSPAVTNRALKKKSPPPLDRPLNRQLKYNP